MFNNIDKLSKSLVFEIIGIMSAVTVVPAIAVFIVMAATYLF